LTITFCQSPFSPRLFVVSVMLSSFDLFTLTLVL
jgi:hypothetical protein